MRKSVLYRILRTFYAGQLVHKGQWYPGSHEPMITIDEFDRAQKILRGARERPRRYRFAFAGLIICGSCASSSPPNGNETKRKDNFSV